jgi:ABC-type antimicrobial peptide transport system permease subunit
VEALGAKRGAALTYTILPGATWGDGAPVTTENVLFTWEVGRHPRSGGGNAELCRRIWKTDVVDEKLGFDYHAIAALLDEAGRALGAGPVRILARHILPNAPLIVATTLAIGNVTLAESVPSFLGLGVQPPLPSWGNTGAQELLFELPRLAWWLGLLIFLTVLALNVLAGGLQAALDPRRG